MKKNNITLLFCALLTSCTNINPDFDHKKTSLSVTEQEVPNTSEETNNPLPTSGGNSTTMDLIVTTSVMPDTSNSTMIEEISTTIENTNSESGDSSGEVIDTTLSDTSDSSTTGPIRMYCGNGLTELGEECDDGNLVDDDSCSKECFSPRIVFLTTDYIGLPNFGGLEAADAFCQADARKFNVPGIFKAWLSDDNELNDPYYRFNSLDYKGWYKLLTYNGIQARIAKGWDGLLSDLEASINITASGIKDNKEPPLMKVFNATGPNGKKNENSTCNNWTSTDINLLSYVGSAQKTDSGWYGYGASSCGSENGGKLYCFQVE